jgi:hypothetical protein
MKVLAAVLVLIAGCTPHQSNNAVPTAASHVSLPACIASPRHDEIPLGPATGHITGNLVASAFAFTRDLAIAPPPQGYQAAVTEAQAECELRSAVTTGPVSGGHLALATVMFTGAQPAPVPSYADRVAWIDVTYSSDVAPSCPAVFEASPTPSPPAPEWPTPQSGPEQIVAVDAATGASGFYYNEHYTCGDDPPAPTAGVPLQVQSLPWTLVSRTSTTLTLRAGWPTREAFAANQYVGPPTGIDVMSLDKQQRIGGAIPVRVWRPLGPQCGADVSHDITVTPDITGDPLPATLVHPPVGIEANG